MSGIRAVVGRFNVQLIDEAWSSRFLSQEFPSALELPDHLYYNLSTIRLAAIRGQSESLRFTGPLLQGGSA